MKPRSKAGLLRRHVTVDDTGARHAGAGKNGYTTQIGSYNFTTFVLAPPNRAWRFCGRGGASLYVINDAALAYMEQPTSDRHRQVQGA